MPTADTTAITADSTIYTSDHYPQDYIDQRAARATGVVPAKAAKAFCSGWKRTLNPGLSARTAYTKGLNTIHQRWPDDFSGQ